jgi:hypothetical protein
MNLTILPDKNGILHVVTDWEANYLTPTQSRMGWTLGLLARDFGELVGLSATPMGSGVYRVVFPHGGIRLVKTSDGPNAKNSFYEELPIKKPRGNVMWKYGRWVK